jgi:TPR repeat protein
MFLRLSALAASGNAEVKFNLGMFLNNGIGTVQDNQAAFRYFSEAAEAGNDLASYKVGCYHAGQFPGVVPVDERAALKFKLRAAEAGYDLAQLDVAMHLGKAGDTAAARSWMEKASRQANMHATAYLTVHLSADTSPDPVTGFALMLTLTERVPNAPEEVSRRMAMLEARLSDAEKTQAKHIRSTWFTGPTPITTKARSGITDVPRLIASLE